MEESGFSQFPRTGDSTLTFQQLWFPWRSFTWFLELQRFDFQAFETQCCHFCNSGGNYSMLINFPKFCLTSKKKKKAYSFKATGPQGMFCFVPPQKIINNLFAENQYVKCLFLCGRQQTLAAIHTLLFQTKILTSVTNISQLLKRLAFQKVFCGLVSFM